MFGLNPIQYARLVESRWEELDTKLGAISFQPNVRHAISCHDISVKACSSFLMSRFLCTRDGGFVLHVLCDQKKERIWHVYESFRTRIILMDGLWKLAVICAAFWSSEDAKCAIVKRQSAWAWRHEWRFYIEGSHNSTWDSQLGILWLGKLSLYYIDNYVCVCGVF